ncbi:hypothetical protein EUTSA_v10008550mg [Eutrema salsugineum]|uniref:GTD-binding domain-containing protein n=1 Tax=Eutrema salsugineum TaxID=72664 RepID=V4L5H1_EUTSA|nr:protein FLOURY 1-like [Eutrema salsugineum]ESQ34978.1 hypothetical protein EUTSA_v10008550mg [Eutrema salsugineum]
MEFPSFLNRTDSFGCGFFIFGCSSQIFNLVFLFCLLVVGLKFLLFKGPSLFVQYIEKKYRISPDREHTDCNNGFVSKSYLVDALDQKKPIILHWSSDCTNGLSLRQKMKKSCEICDHLLLRDELDDLSKNRDTTAALSERELEQESEEEESRSPSDSEDQVFDVITLKKMVKRERKRGDFMKIELEKERRAAESAAEEAMAMLLKLRMEKSVVEMEAKHYKRVAEQKQVYDQEVIQSLQWMLTMKLDDEEKIQD